MIPSQAGQGSGRPLHERPWLRPALVAAAIALVSIAHYLVPERQLVWQNLLQHLYLVPIMYAALRYGWRGGLIATAAATASYLPQLLAARGAQPYPGYMLSRIAGMVEYFAAAALVGLLAEKDSRQRRRLEQSSRDLERLNYELQGTIERMKRSERLYAVGQLAAGLAHEIRNPIAAIGGAAGILERHPDDAAKRKTCIEIISKECARLNRLLSNFLDFARPRPPSFQRTQLEPLAASVIELARHAAGRHSVELRCEFPSSLPEIECDGEQIKQVLLNLAINAIQASPDGGEIVVSARTANGSVIVSIRDQGCGMTPEQMQRLFDPFFTTKETGTGLGLPVAFQIVQQHHGRIWAERNPDRGMTFSFELPLKREPKP
jgi:signal transduction histidine kinase